MSPMYRYQDFHHLKDCSASDSIPVLLYALMAIGCFTDAWCDAMCNYSLSMIWAANVHHSSCIQQIAACGIMSHCYLLGHLRSD